MKKWNLIIDVAECHNCHNCFIACKDEYVDNDIDGYTAAQPLHGHRWIDIKSKERGTHPRIETAYVPVMCNHCDDAPCVAAGNGAVTKRADGIVMIDPVKAKGREDIVASCPYGAIWWNEEKSLPQNWIFDAHLLDRGWSEPRCVQSCPTSAMKALKITDAEMAKIALEEDLQPIDSSHATKPRVHYKNLHRFTSVFVAGEILVANGDNVECCGEVDVILSRDGTEIGRTSSDAFGEYLIDGIAPETADCVLSFGANGLQSAEIAISVGDECVVVDTLTMRVAASN